MDVYTGPEGILNHGDQVRSRLFIDSSTIDPQTSRKLSAAVAATSLNGIILISSLSKASFLPLH